jgi:hypothetical protein
MRDEVAIHKKSYLLDLDDPRSVSEGESVG